MNTYLSHAYAQARENDIRRSVVSSRTTDVWHRSGHAFTDLIGRTLVHLGTRLLDDRQSAAEPVQYSPRVAA